MNKRSRIVLLGLFAVLAAAVWGASASLPLARSSEQPDRRAKADKRQPAQSQAFDVDQIAARLRTRQRESPSPREGGRNPFDYARVSAPPTPALAIPAPAVLEASAPPPPPPPVFTLSGIADKTGQDGAAVRTAVISGLGQLYFAKVGDTVAARYSVTAIGADAVELRDVTTGETIRLALQ